ncbi:lipase family protein [Williamsia deligens]|nr:Secretory lipase [Williamsia deligens]
MVLVAVVVAVAVAVVVLTVSRRSETRAPTAASVPGAQIGGSAPGSLVSAEPMPGFARSLVGSSMRSARVLYRSGSGDTSAPTVVSAAVFSPRRTAPPGGWPVIAFAHATAGIDEPCAPSYSDTLKGQVGVLDAFIRLGYAVAMPDYQGLGAPGVHQYLDARTAGLNTVDAVRALRATFPDISTRWGAYGGSQGGGASWAVAELGTRRAPDLTLVGAVAISPAADVSGLVDKAQARTLTPDQGPTFQAVVESLARTHPDVDRDDFRRGDAARDWDVLSACAGPLLDRRDAAVADLSVADLAPRTTAAADTVRRVLDSWALPQGPSTTPLYVEYGGRDTFVDPRWTTAALARQCALGGSVTYRLDPDRGHGDVPTEQALEWLARRFAGTPATSTCPSPGR